MRRFVLFVLLALPLLFLSAANIQTDPVVEKIIEKERPDAILPTMGGQTGLNTALALAESGVLEKYGVELIGADQNAIAKAEDRKLFDTAMKKIGLETPRASVS